MKANPPYSARRWRWGLLGSGAAVLVLTGSCSESPPPRPVPRPTLIALPPSPQIAPRIPAPLDWRDAAIRPGVWRWQATDAGGEAQFGEPAAIPAIVLRCDRRAGVVTIRVGYGGAAGTADLAIATSTQTRVVMAQAVSGAWQATVAARDSLLDAMALSRGRFAVNAPGVALYLPAWPEVARVVEDCRLPS